MTAIDRDREQRRRRRRRRAGACRRSPPTALPSPSALRHRRRGYFALGAVDCRQALRVFGRVVVDDPFDQQLVGDHHRAAVAGVDVGVGEGDVGDPALVLFEGRCGRRSGTAARRAIWIPATMLAIVCWAAKPTISADHRGRGEDAGRQPLQLGELAQREHRRGRGRSARKSRRRGCAAGSWSSGRPVKLPATWSTNLAADAVDASAPARPSPTPTGGPGRRVLGRRAGARHRDRARRSRRRSSAPRSDGDLTTCGNVGVQLGTELGFLLVPMAIAAQRGAATLGEILAPARRAPLPALGAEVDGGGGRRLPALRDRSTRR